MVFEDSAWEQECIGTKKLGVLFSWILFFLRQLNLAIFHKENEIFHILGGVVYLSNFASKP